MTALIYKLYVDEEEKDERCYIGSTIRSMKKRLLGHFYKRSRCTSNILIDQYGKDKIKYVILEECETSIRKVRERYWIENTENIINKCLPTITNNERLIKCKKYRDENKDKIKNRCKKYMLEHKDDKKKYDIEYRKKNIDKQKEKRNCECGGKFTYSYISKHIKTKKHQAYLNQLNSFIPVCTVEAASATQIHTDNQALSS